jgi:hypothetical protein
MNMNTNIDGAKAMAGLAIVGALLLPTAALAQTKSHTFRDASGRAIGRSVTDTKGNATYYDSMGRNTGRSVTSGGTTTVYDQMGRQTGTIRGSR